MTTMNLRAYTKQLDSAATGRNIQGRLHNLGMTAADLARAIRKSPAYVSRIISGERQIKPRMMKRIEEALGCRQVLRQLAKERGQ